MISETLFTSAQKLSQWNIGHKESMFRWLGDVMSFVAKFDVFASKFVRFLEAESSDSVRKMNKPRFSHKEIKWTDP